MAPLTMTVVVDMTEFDRAIERARAMLDRQPSDRTIERARAMLDRQPSDRAIDVPLVLGAAAALATTPRKISRRSLLGMPWRRA